MITQGAFEWFRCPKCQQVGRYTDGTSVELGDEADEYWCQVCGAQVPLHECIPVPPPLGVVRT